MRDRPAGFWRAHGIGAATVVTGQVTLADDESSAVETSAGGWELSTRYAETPPGPVLDRDSLDPLLEELGTFRTPSIWDRLLSWLEETLGRQPDTRLPDWFGDTQLPWDWVFYASCVLVVVLAVVIIANELRVRKGGRRGQARPERRAAQGSDAALTFDHLGALPVRDQPAALLRMILQRLRLPERPGSRFSVTHQEIAATAAALPAGAIEPMRRIAATAERIRYAGQPPEPDDVREAVADGRRVLEALDG